MSEELRIRPGSMTKYLLALALSTQVLTAWAQENTSADADDEQTDEESLELDRVQVTGSLLKREDFTSTKPMQVIDAETQFQAGQLTVADMLQGTTVAAGTTQLNNQFTGFVVQGGTGVQTLNLRGIGDNRTLVLLNGRRPGASGTRGQTNSVDLSNIPTLAVQRFEIVLDGSSSIYGSDAVAGVANIITRRSVDGTELNALAEVPLDSGGEYYQAGLITGLNWDTGAFTVSAEWSLQESLTIADRDYLSCTTDYVFDADTGARIDRQDRSAIDDSLRGCNQLYADTVLDFINGGRLIPTPDGRETVLPGYRPRENAGYGPNGEPAFYEDILNFPFTGSETAIGELERVNIYATFDQSFGNIDWDAEFLYSNRQSATENWRQFFPTIVTFDGTYDEPYPFPDPIGGAFLPVMPYPSDTNVEVDYFYFTTGLSGVLPTDNYWSWQVYGAYSYGDGDYSRNSILVANSGDASDPRVTQPPLIDYLRPDILNGTSMMELINAVGVTNTGNTVYDQTQVTAILAGDAFQLPAGILGTAIGVEYRRFSIDDQPSQFSQNDELWGESSAGRTKGTNDVMEVFGEVEVPILAGMTGVEELTLSASARYFDYDKGGSDWVWSAGLRWQIVPSIALRGTVGTSYRAPALFELFLADETSFAGQTAVDACIDWGESTNEFIRANCAADGIPSDYTGFPSTSARIVSGGGVGNLEAETSDSMTFGVVWTPEFTNLNVAVDYFEIEVNDQISQLGGASIVQGCYSGENFPNAFCDLFTREPGDANFPFNIIDINDAFVNINQQTVKGVDLNATWAGDYDWGSLNFELQTTYTMERVQRLFAPGSVEGFDEVDNVGSVGNPEYVTNFRTTARKDDWSVTYFLQYVSETDESDFANEDAPYFGYPNPFRDLTMDAVFYHNLSFLYQQDKWDVLLGINNILDEEPDFVSTGVGLARRGNVPVAATQYDLLGRRIFGRVNFRF